MKPLARQGGIVVALLALAATFFVFPGLQELVWAVVHFGSAAAVVLGVHRHRPNVRLPWYLLAAGIAFFGLGDLVLVGLDSSLQVVADACWLSTYLLFTVALLKLVRVRRRGGTWLRCSTPWWSRPGSP